MRRTHAIAAAGAAAILATSGVAAQSDSPAPAAALDCGTADAVTITFWHTYNTDGPETKQFDDVVLPGFKAVCPNITVNSVVQPYDGLHDQLVTSVAGGGLPDVMRMDIIWTPEFAALGALVPVDGLPGFADIASQVFPGPLATNQYQGATYGLPLDTNTQVLITNTQLIPTAPTTQDEVRAAAEAVKGDEQWGLALGGAGGWNIFPWFWSAGGSVTDDAYTTASGYLDSDASIAALQWIVDLKNDDLLGPSVTGGSPDSWGGFQAGQYGMLSDGPWFFPIIGTGMGDFVQPSLLPAGPGGSISVVGGENVVIFSTSPNQAAAWAFSRYLLSDEAQVAMAEVGQLPVTASASASDVITGVPYYAPYIEQLKTARPRPVTPAWVQMDPILTDAFTAALRGDKTPADALHEAAAQIDPLLAGD